MAEKVKIPDTVALTLMYSLQVCADIASDFYDPHDYIAEMGPIVEAGMWLVDQDLNEIDASMFHIRMCDHKRELEQKVKEQED